MSEASQETQMAPREAETKTAPTATIAPTETGQLHVDTPATAAIIGLLPGTGKIVGGKILFRGHDITTLNKKQQVALRGSHVGMVPQDPMSNLNPVWKIGFQVKEALTANRKAKGREDERVVELLEEAGLPNATRRVKQYPHEFSGGQRQRVAIARALALRPEIIVLDEAVSALDVLVQEQILQLLADIQHDSHITYLFITHDLAVVRQMADEVVVMQSGRVVERGSVDVIFDRPQEAYTRDLIEAIPGRNIPLWNGD
ncbi:ABC transporter ATP-binding protein [Mobiluncus mulieris]|uniref:ABC transporter ATP-binding protein n=1 Tax=Mobiluncus mulieris TaxID=2052 RepID=UPI0021E2712E|nr:ABC transporter ATP-binding protein [Mobiluncus mulieris]MCV0002074.1 ABC transporter ATP-binding protein [Mobiluncus mulieris]